jgi:hypothetical protein
VPKNIQYPLLLVKGEVGMTCSVGAGGKKGHIFGWGLIKLSHPFQEGDFIITGSIEIRDAADDFIAL